MSNRCDHDACGCTVQGEDYCSEYCAQRDGSPELTAVPDDICQCGHPACTDSEE